MGLQDFGVIRFAT